MKELIIEKLTAYGMTLTEEVCGGNYYFKDDEVRLEYVTPHEGTSFKHMIRVDFHENKHLKWADAAYEVFIDMELEVDDLIKDIEELKKHKEGILDDLENDTFYMHDNVKLQLGYALDFGDVGEKITGVQVKYEIGIFDNDNDLMHNYFEAKTEDEADDILTKYFYEDKEAKYCKVDRIETETKTIHKKDFGRE